MKINAPIRISVKENYMNSIFQKIVTTAQQCHLSVPETEYGRHKKRYRQFVNRSLIFATGMPIFTIMWENSNIKQYLYFPT